MTQAMGALDKDPLVSRILEQLAERVEAVFTPQGKLKTAADSPVVKLQDHLRTSGISFVSCRRMKPKANRSRPTS